MNYWLNLFTGKTWREFLAAGSSVSGFRASRWPAVQKIQLGDRLLCYATGISRFVGVLEVTSSAYQEDKKNIWSDEAFPSRLEVKSLVTLQPEFAVPVLSLREQLSVLKNLKNPGAWTGHFRGSPAKWKSEDGDLIFQILQDAEKNPVSRPFNEKKLDYRPLLVRSKIGSVAIPDPDQTEISPVSLPNEKENTAHDKIQKILAKLGADLGLDVWVARNDRGRTVDGVKLSEMPRLLSDLPIHFDDATKKTIELIDVLWLRGKTIVAAFEIESTTSIYSRLLRMADLIAMQPNLNIPLYIVAPEERRERVMNEIRRPTFSRLEPPMREMCGYISFSALTQKIKEIAPFVA